MNKLYEPSHEEVCEMVEMPSERRITPVFDTSSRQSGQSSPRTSASHQ
jgi:hypothetical protein